MTCQSKENLKNRRCSEIFSRGNVASDAELQDCGHVVAHHLIRAPALAHDVAGEPGIPKYVDYGCEIHNAFPERGVAGLHGLPAFRTEVLQVHAFETGAVLAAHRRGIGAARSDVSGIREKSEIALIRGGQNALVETCPHLSLFGVVRECDEI